MHQSHRDFLERILSHIEQKPYESVGIYDSLGKVLATYIKALRPFPAKDTVSSDGYAIICENTKDAPINLHIVGESTAESPFSGKVNDGQAVRTYVGSPLPEGTDTVIEDNECEVEGDSIRITRTVLHSQNILYCGIDFQIDEVMLKRGYKITAIDLAIAASMNLSSLNVSKPPEVGILEIGDMLIK